MLLGCALECADSIMREYFATDMTSICSNVARQRVSTRPGISIHNPLLTSAGLDALSIQFMSNSVLWPGFGPFHCVVFQSRFQYQRTISRRGTPANLVRAAAGTRP